jgi:YVTN family beta-propeller protein
VNAHRRAVRRLTALIALAFAATACAGGSTGPSTLTSTAPSLAASATPVVTPAATAILTASPGPSFQPTELIDAGSTRLTVRPFADWVVVTDEAAWVAVGEAVTKLDATDGTELGSTSVPGETCLAMDVGFDAVWVGACAEAGASIVRIDPASGAATATIPLGVDLQFEGSIAAGEGSVWAISLQPDQVLLQIDPAAGAVVQRYPIDGVSAGVRAGYGGVWITRPDDDAVLRVDPADGSIVATIPVGDTPRFLAVGEDAIWAMNESDGTVSRIDPTTNEVIATIAVSRTPVTGGDIAVGGGAVWARVSDVLVSRIDPGANAVTIRYGPPAGSGSVAADDAAAWVSAHDVNTVWRLPLQP